MNGRSPLQVLYEYHLIPSRNNDGLFDFLDTKDAAGHVTSLTIVTKKGLELYRQFPELLLLDSTYRTNIHNMPLFNCCSVTSQNKTFNWAIVFMSGEIERHYKTALKVLQHLLEKHDLQPPGCIITDQELAFLNSLNQGIWCLVPHLLCKWNVNMNILTKIKRCFPVATKKAGYIERHPTFKTFLADYNQLITAPTEAEYTQLLGVFKTPGQHPTAAVAYIEDTWLIPWKKKLVAYWTNQMPHFGHTTTSVVESSHASLKRWLSNS